MQTYHWYDGWEYQEVRADKVVFERNHIVFSRKNDNFLLAVHSNLVRFLKSGQIPASQEVPKREAGDI